MHALPLDSFRGFGDGKTTFDLFISYRVDADLALAEKLFWRLKCEGINAFWDKECLPGGYPWKESFLKGKSFNSVAHMIII